MTRRLPHLAAYSAGYVLVLLLERIQAQLELQQAAARARAERETAEAIAKVLVQTVRVSPLEEELQAAVDLEAVAAAHVHAEECCR